ncbi:hypothetical protein HNO88_003951 [Novosphingobium chloroacetimidivorans]|uniref:SMODS and SLOG-associating 2TM effector domain-containing protein n=1 Tax=Novosphingobium chloroacetimidivorans TaxID=1428314 RepID=A0A7W7KD27_9SPHN|nr:hypothetical protein [Novosphingobium chloroacetimidivorans]MBB4860607.1 hypothetical protein [Novosphingobium chloroacetimidivorans]
MTEPMWPAGRSAGDNAPIAIGITGHRLERLANVDLAALQAQVDKVMSAMSAASPGSRFRLIGSLAEGADMATANAALGRGWQLDTVLPFGREEYARDFDRGGAMELSALLDRSTNVLELPGQRDEPGGEAAAYERAGRVVLTQSDLLLAVWDGAPPRGRGGAAQIVAEAVTHAIPVLILHPEAVHSPRLLWSGLNRHDSGPEAIDTVARGGLDDLPHLMTCLASAMPADADTDRRWKMRYVPALFGIAYPLLLAVTGVRRLRLSDLRRPCPASRLPSTAPPAAMLARIHAQLWPRFDAADCEASLAAQLFRSAFVSSFVLAALAVTLALIGLIVPTAVKPLLAAGEFASIAMILFITSWGARAGWHDRWIEQRTLAEELRCLAVSAQLGDLFLRGVHAQDADGAKRERREIARRLELPSAKIDDIYVAEAHASLAALLDDQIGYVRRESDRMHRLEHRLHRLGGALFSVTALVCAGVLGIEVFWTLSAHGGGEAEHNLPLGITVVSASLPAIGAAIYGIRMQGDFAGAAERNAILATHLAELRRIVSDEAPGFDGLRRLIRRSAELLTADVFQWVRATRARPLSLPG